jgi:hypothetical protein
VRSISMWSNAPCVSFIDTLTHRTPGFRLVDMSIDTQIANPE